MQRIRHSLFILHFEFKKFWAIQIQLNSIEFWPTIFFLKIPWIRKNNSRVHIVSQVFVYTKGQKINTHISSILSEFLDDFQVIPSLAELKKRLNEEKSAIIISNKPNLKKAASDLKQNNVAVLYIFDHNTETEPSADPFGDYTDVYITYFFAPINPLQLRQALRNAKKWVKLRSQSLQNPGNRMPDRDHIYYLVDLFPDHLLKINEDGSVDTFKSEVDAPPFLAGEDKRFIDELMHTSAIDKIWNAVDHSKKTAQPISLQLSDRELNSAGNYQARVRSISGKEAFLHIRKLGERQQESYPSESGDKKFRILLESASQAILLSDMHGRMKLVNKRLEDLFGYSRDELLDQPVEKLIPGHLRQQHLRHRLMFLNTPQSRQMGAEMDIHGLHKEGYEIPLEVHLSSIEIYEGRFILVFINDLSQRKKLDRRLREIEKLEAIGQLAGGVAHDFNNVLAGIMGLIELSLRELPQKSSVRNNLELILQKAGNAAHTVQQLLAFSRKKVLEKRQVNLSDTARNNLKLLTRYLGEDINLKTRLESKLPFIHADPAALDQIITNLCINARDAMPDGGDLIIKTKHTRIENPFEASTGVLPPGHYIELAVIDSGMGMRQETVKHIFEPFYTTKEVGDGTGLGLSIIYGLVKQHNGYIHCESILGEGTCFTIYFPVSKTQKRESHAQQKETIKGGNETILLVEDEADLLQTFKALLENYGYEVWITSNGNKALNIIQQYGHQIDMIVSDIVMPEMGGIELKILVQQLYPHIRFLLMTAHPEKVEPGMEFLQKPFQLERLALKIRKMLDQPPESPQ